MHICVSPIISLCVLLTHCLGDKAFIFPLCKFFFSFLVSHLFRATSFVLNGAIRRQHTNNLPAAFFVIRRLRRPSSLTFRCEVSHFLWEPRGRFFPAMVRKFQIIHKGIQKSLNKQRWRCGRSRSLKYQPTEAGDKIDKSCSLGAWPYTYMYARQSEWF